MSLLIGGVAAQEPAADEPVEETRRGRGPLGPDPIATFYVKLKEAMAVELQVLDFERQTLGTENPEMLSGHRLRRYERIQEDLDFTSQAGRFSQKRLKIPHFKPDASPSREELAVLTNLTRAYESSRNTRQIEQFIAFNDSFQRTGDWVQRDQAVRLRDDLIEREAGFKTLMIQAAEVARGEADPELIDEMQSRIAELAPDSESKSGLAVMVLKNEALRRDVQAEVMELLSAPVKPKVELPPEDDLLDRLADAWGEAHSEAGVTDLITQYIALRTELATVEDRLEKDDKLGELIVLHAFAKNEEAEERDTAKKLSEEVRAQLENRRDQLADAIRSLQVDWWAVPVPQEAVEIVAAAQDDLIQRRMIDLGPPGSLFAQRYDRIKVDAEATRAGDLNGWEFLDRQTRLLEDLAAARPDYGPLRGLKPPPSPAQLEANKKLLSKINKAPGKPNPKKKAYKAGYKQSSAGKFGQKVGGGGKKKWSGGGGGGKGKGKGKKPR